MGIEESEQMNLWKILAAILHLGNIVVAADRSDQARLPDVAQAELACHILGIPSDGFLKGLLNPRVRAGREWVNQSRTKDQVLYSLDSLAKTLYEKSFGYLVERINQSMERNSMKTSFIGVLDIAGFEIFKTNGFEQLCINYTNEKLQQFFNHHMFVLEQEEYAREDIEWKFIDFGCDLQPTIDLIEKSNVIAQLCIINPSRSV
jgi:myosin protein heavy chain